MNKPIPQIDNGVNVTALLEAREAFAATPDAARFQWRAHCSWVNGTHSKARVRDYHGLGAPQQHRTSFAFDIDHPETFAADDQGATPVEFVLVGRWSDW